LAGNIKIFIGKMSRWAAEPPSFQALGKDLLPHMPQLLKTTATCAQQDSHGLEHLPMKIMTYNKEIYYYLPIYLLYLLSFTYLFTIFTMIYL